MTTRREFVERATLSAMGLALPFGAEPARDVPLHGDEDVLQQATGYLDLRREPSRVLVHLASGEQVLTRGTNGRWTGDNGIVVSAALTGEPEGQQGGPTRRGWPGSLHRQGRQLAWQPAQ